MSVATKYNDDFYGWTKDQVSLLKAGDFSGLDVVHLIEEIDSMGKSETRQLHNRLEVLLMYLLKWQFQPSYQGNSWRNTIEEQRVRIRKHLSKNPSLKSVLDETFLDAYEDARYSARRETGLDLEMFPEKCLWDFEQVMDEGFWPKN